jgi:TolB-like protein/DNA-binding winged helix-turn-helix (wHTH) protein
MQLAREAALDVGGLRVRPATREVEWPGGREVLQPRAMQVLVALAQARGAVVSRDDLIASCWDGRVVSEDAINFVIAKLRKLAQRTGGFRLETIPRVGYRLTAPEHAGAPLRPGWRPGRRALLAGGAAAAVLAGGGIFALREWWRPGAREPLTLAVLPFTDVSSDPEAAYLSAGLTRAVRGALSQIGGLRVIADTSSQRLAEQKLSQAEVARRLGADLLLTGAVTESRGAVRVSLDLVDPRRGTEVWSQSAEGPVDDLFRLLDTASAEALAALTSRLGPDRLRAPTALRPRNPIVFRNVLEADDLLERSRTLRMVGNDAEGSTRRIAPGTWRRRRCGSTPTTSARC